jgi:16S rRNA (cytosine1402-N4)-methyltransferase
VNREMESLQAGLIAAVGTLRPTGRLAVITFHSLEDRAVKEFGRTRCRDYTYPGTVDVPELRVPRVPELKWVTRKAMKPSDQELQRNVRSRSAQLRVLERT